MSEASVQLRRRSIVVSILAAAFLTLSATAETYYVRATGDNGSSGTHRDEAWRTIGHALDRLTAGDVLYVGAGAYEQELVLDASGDEDDPIRIIGDVDGAATGDAGDVVLLGDRRTRVLWKLDGVEHVEIRGFVVRGSKSTGVEIVNSRDVAIRECTIEGMTRNHHSDGILVRNSDAEIIDCTVRNVRARGVRLAGDSHVVLRSCDIHDNGKAGVHSHSNNAEFTITRCRITGNGEHGVAFKRGRGLITDSFISGNRGDGVVILNDRGSDLRIWNCTITFNSRNGVWRRFGTIEVRNSVIAFNGRDGLSGLNRRTEFVHSHNLCFGNSGSDWGGMEMGETDLNEDPLLIASSDFRLRASSPVVNAGTDATEVTSRDINNVDRPSHGGWDLGCYEVDGDTPLFVDVTEEAGFGRETAENVFRASGMHWADYDGDGDLDAVITGSTAYLMRNGGASFHAAAFGGSLRRQAAMIDLENDGDVDLWFVSMNDDNLERCFGNDGYAGFTNLGHLNFYQPASNEGCAAADIDADGMCDVVMFSRNGNFVGFNRGTEDEPLLEASTDPEIGLNAFWSWGLGSFVSSADVNNDGWLDFFYHFLGGRLFLSNGDGTWTSSSRSIRVITGFLLKSGSAWGDYDNDGDVDLFVCRPIGGCSLWRNDGGGSFRDVAASAGLTDRTPTSSATWGDYDNDGDLDIYVTALRGENLLWRNNGDGTFAAADEGVNVEGPCHDAVFVDYDNDGDLDLAVVREGQGNLLFRNELDEAADLKVRVVGAGRGATNAAGIGVRVEVWTADGGTLLGRRDIGTARGFAGTEPIWAHFGGLNIGQTHLVRAHFLSGVVEAEVAPASASTDFGGRLVPRLLTLEEPSPRETLQVLEWREAPPDD